MKGFIFSVVFFAVSFGFLSNSYALDGSGTVEEVKICTNNQGAFAAWNRLFFFKLSDDNWFGTFLNNPVADTKYDGDAIYSFVLSAFNIDQIIDVRANYTTLTMCGITAAMLYNTTGDYVTIKK